MTQLNNSVGRLYDLLIDLLNVNGTKSMIHEEFDFFKNYNFKKSVSIFEQVSDILNLIEESKLTVKNIEYLEYDRYLKPLLTLERLFKSINLHGSWNDFKKGIDQVTMTQLEYCSDAVSRESQEKIIESKKIDDLLKDIEILEKKFVELNINNKLFAIILEHINDIKFSLINYKIFGVNGLRKSLESGLGAVILNGDEIKQNLENNLDDGKFKSFFEILQRLNTLVNLGNNTPKLIESASKIIHHLLA